MINSALLGLDGSAYCESALQVGIQWAKRSGASLTGLAVVDEPTICKPEPTGIGGSYYKKHRDESRLKDAERRVELFLEDFSTRCAKARIHGQALRKVGLPSDQLVAEAEDHDLLLLGQRSHFHFETQEDDDETLEVVLRRTSQPVVVVPVEQPASSDVVVAYDASPQATRALEAFERVGLFAGQTVHVVSVARDEGSAIRNSEEATQYLCGHGFTARARPLPQAKPVAEMLLEQVEEVGAGMLVMGAHRRSRLREALFGSTTRTILEKSQSMLFLHN